MKWLQFSFLLILIFMNSVFNLSASPKFLRLSYTGDTSSSITIVWNTDVETESIVRYGKVSKNYTDVARGFSFKANGALNYIHEVTLTGLEPNTVYYYIAGSEIDGFSAERSFKTGPKEDDNCAEFSFGYLGDNRPDPTFGGGENWPKILEQCAAHNPNFTINGGDLVVDGDQIDQWIKFLGWTEKISSKIPFMPTIGNHDDGPGQGDTANYNQIFALPKSLGIYGSNTEDYYYFTFGNAIFVSLSTQTFKEGNIPFEKQAKWLDEVLTSNPKKWKFVYYHHPSYTKNVAFDISHEPNEVNQNAAFIPIFDKHHVDIVFTSHNHWYERFEPSACANAGNAGSAQPCSVGQDNYDKGTVFVVSGGAGAFTIPGLLCGTMRGRVKCSGDHHYVIVKIKNEVLTYEAYSAYPQENKVLDSFSITKKSDNCISLPDGGYEDISQDGYTDINVTDTYVIRDTYFDNLGYEITDFISVEDGEIPIDAIDDVELVDMFYQDVTLFEDDISISNDVNEMDFTDVKDVWVSNDISITKDVGLVNTDDTSGCGCNFLR